MKYIKWLIEVEIVVLVILMIWCETYSIHFKDGKALELKNKQVSVYEVYIETDYDTDADGELDMIKVLVKVPEVAVKGIYKAAAVYVARPYSAGVLTEEEHTKVLKDIDSADGNYDKKYLEKADYKKREASKIIKSADMKKTVEYYDDSDAVFYNHLLDSGFAVISCGGLGTYGSDGICTVGTEAEAASFNSVIEWLCGERVGFISKDSDIGVKADWCNKSIGMYGKSFAGSTQIEVAEINEHGLKTIVPIAGVVDWYEYAREHTNGFNSSYTDYLGSFCTSRIKEGLSEDEYNTVLNYFKLMKNEQNSIEMREQHFKERDHTEKKINIPVLAVYGRNDDNVKLNQLDLLVEKAENIKVLLHNGGHVIPDSSEYNDIVNSWFTEYLYGVKNNREWNILVEESDSDEYKEYNNYTDIRNSL